VVKGKKKEKEKNTSEQNPRRGHSVLLVGDEGVLQVGCEIGGTRSGGLWNGEEEEDFNSEI